MPNNNGTLRMETRVPLSEVMRYHPTTIDSEATVSNAAAAMCRDEVGSCIVLRHNIPVGIITESDINCKVVAKNRQPGRVQVQEVMSTPLITIDSGKTVDDAAHMMIANRVRRLPVVEDHRVIGIVTVRDILSVSTEVNEIMAHLIEINRSGDEEEFVMGICDRCGRMSDQLISVDSSLLCPQCREEEKL
ncbi:MAG: CBS domain-containing protein [Methanoculleaceae archaeon]